jgi:hypothetical protein
MSLQGLLYHAFALKDQEYLKTEYESGNVIIHIQTWEEHLRCSSCKSKDVVRKGFVESRFRTVSIGLKPVFPSCSHPTVAMPFMWPDPSGGHQIR